MIRLRTIPAALAVAVGCAVLAGCGGDGMKTAPVKGKVTYKGKPVSVGTITFVPDGNAPAATGELKADGSYELTTYKPGDGAVLGKHTIMIVALQDQSGRLPEDRNPLPPPIIPNKYLNNQLSGLTAEVKDEANTIDFDLTGDLGGKPSSPKP